MTVISDRDVKQDLGELVSSNCQEMLDSSILFHVETHSYYGPR